MDITTAQVRVKISKLGTIVVLPHQNSRLVTGHVKNYGLAPAVVRSNLPRVQEESDVNALCTGLSCS